jgi:hypothetical protein
VAKVPPTEARGRVLPAQKGRAGRAKSPEGPARVARVRARRLNSEAIVGALGHLLGPGGLGAPADALAARRSESAVPVEAEKKLT